MRQRLIERVRRFNRFYTQKIGVLGEGVGDGRFSLTEVRVLYEIAHADATTAKQIGDALGLDSGYLSRILDRFEKNKLVEKRASPVDRRRALLSLTTKGSRAFAPLEARAQSNVAAMMEPLRQAERAQVLAAMSAIERALGGSQNTGFSLRSHRSGDLGWIVSRHGEIYKDEYGWDERFEGLCAGIVAKFAAENDPKTEHCWIAERDEERAGTVMLVRESKTCARLRLLLVEPSARGLGIGARLVGECIRFAKNAGYAKMVLWTQSVLMSARKIYAGAGFALTKEDPHESFGHRLVGQTWERPL